METGKCPDAARPVGQSESMKQTDDKPDIHAEGYDPRQREVRNMVDDRRDTGAEYHRIPQRVDHNQQQYRQSMPPRPREITMDEFDTRDEPVRSMASHPLFRGLLQELPPRTSPPSKEWLDRWSETARSILELLYSRDQVTLTARIASASKAQTPP